MQRRDFLRLAGASMASLLMARASSGNAGNSQAGYRAIRSLPRSRHVFRTVVISPPIILRRLHDQLTGMGVLLVQKELDNLSQLEEPVIVNCAGTDLAAKSRTPRAAVTQALSDTLPGSAGGAEPTLAPSSK